MLNLVLLKLSAGFAGGARVLLLPHDRGAFLRIHVDGNRGIGEYDRIPVLVRNRHRSQLIREFVYLRHRFQEFPTSFSLHFRGGTICS